MNRKDCVLGAILGLTFGVGVTLGMSLQEYDCKPHSYPQNITSIEYLEACQCGSDLMECYKSLKDGYEYKECKECGSHFNNKGE